MQNYLLAQTVLAELQITNAGSITAGNRFLFGDVPELRRVGVKVYGIICHSLDFDYSTSTGGNAIMGTVELRQCLLTIVNKEQKQPIEQEPLISFVPGSNGGFIRFLNPIDIDIQKCYIELTGTTSIVLNDTWAFSFIYTYYNS